MASVKISQLPAATTPLTGTELLETVQGGASRRVAVADVVPVQSVHGRTGDVAAATSDYDASQIDNDSGVSGGSVAAALDQLDTNDGVNAAAAAAATAAVAADLATLDGEVSALVTGVSSVHGRTGDVVAATSDYDASQVDNDSGVAGATVAAALDQLDSDVSALVTGVSSVHGRTGDVVAASGDYTAAQVTNDSGVTGVTVANALDRLNLTGWADYADTQYTSGSPFPLSANTDTDLPNNGLGGVQTYEPSDDIFYLGGRITGRNGDGLMVTVEFTVTPTSGAATVLDVWFDIGGSVGELYRRPVTFPKGAGVERTVTFTVAGYTLDTWEANGARVRIRCDGACTIHSIRYVLTRTHWAPRALSPLEVDGLTAWYGSTVTGAGTAGFQVVDLSGNGNHGTQTNVANQPTVSGGALNFAMANSQHYDISATATGLSGATRFAIVARQTKVTNSRVFMADNAFAAFDWAVNAGGNWQVLQPDVISGPQANGSVALLFDGGSSFTLRSNGAVIAQITSAVPAAVPAFSSLAIGGPVNCWDGTMSNVFIIAGRVPTEYELRMLENWGV